LQLSQEDKRDMARKIYHMTPERERDSKKVSLAKMLSVSERTIARWLDRIDKDTKEANKKKAFDLWLALHTQKEIEESTHIDQSTISVWSDKNIIFGQLSENNKAEAAHANDFVPPLYNTWKFQEQSAGSKHHGNSESTIVDNLLYLYTQPFDVVIDPFAGGVCRLQRSRRNLSNHRRA
jgi:transposase